MRAHEILDHAAAARPQGIAVQCPEARLSYAEVRERVGRLSGAFRRLGAAPGDRIALLHRNCHRFFECYWAALEAGAVLVPVNPHLAGTEMRSVLEDAAVRLVVAEPAVFLAHAPMLMRLASPAALIWTGPIPPFEDPRFHFYERLIEEGSAAGPRADFPDDALAHIYYTSGSTGAPKGVMLTRGNLVAHLERAIPEFDIARETGWGHIAPMFHLADAWAVWAVTAAAGTHAFLPRFSPSAAVRLLATGAVTMTNLVPTMYARMVREPELKLHDFSALKLLLSGGAPIAGETVLRILSAFRCEYAQTYGLTETSPFLTLSRPREAMLAWPLAEQIRIRCTTGRPLRGVEVRVVDEEGRAVPGDGRTPGEIQARGPTVTPGYWNRPEETRAAFREGWLRTGDLAVIDADGYLTIVDRLRDVINTGGEKVYSLEVENTLAAHPEVIESAVVGLPDPDLGETVAAVVVTRPGSRVAPEELMAHCARHLTYYKVPRRVRFLEELPRTGSGKILKRALRDDFDGGFPRSG